MYRFCAGRIVLQVVSRQNVESMSATEAKNPKCFFEAFLSTPFWASTFQSLFFGSFPPGEGFGTSLNGHQESDGPNVPSCAVKTCAVRPVFTRVVRELRAADPSKCPRAHKQNASPGNKLRLRDKGGSRGRSSTQNPKTRTVRTCWINPGGLSLITVSR